MASDITKSFRNNRAQLANKSAVIIVVVVVFRSFYHVKHLYRCVCVLFSLLRCFYYYSEIPTTHLVFFICSCLLALLFRRYFSPYAGISFVFRYKRISAIQTQFLFLATLFDEQNVRDDAAYSFFCWRSFFFLYYFVSFYTICVSVQICWSIILSLLCVYYFVKVQVCHNSHIVTTTFMRCIYRCMVSNVFPYTKQYSLITYNMKNNKCAHSTYENVYTESMRHTEKKRAESRERHTQFKTKEWVNSLWRLLVIIYLEARKLYCILCIPYNVSTYIYPNIST